MTSEKFTFVTLSGPTEQVDLALCECLKSGCFFPENAIESMKKIKTLYSFETANPYSAALDKAFAVMEAVQLAPERRDSSGRGYGAEDTIAYLEDLHARVSALCHERDAAAKHMEDIESLRSQLRHLQIINEPLRDLFDMKYVEFRFGRLPLENYDECTDAAKQRSDVYYIHTGEDDRWAYVVYFALPSTADQVDAVFGSHGFTRIRVSDAADGSVTADETLRRLERDAEDTADRMKSLELSLHRLVRQENADEFMPRYSFLHFLSDAYDLRAFAGYRHDRFYVAGWLLKKDAPELARRVAALGFGCTLASPKEIKSAVPPKNIKISHSNTRLLGARPL